MFSIIPMELLTGVWASVAVCILYDRTVGNTTPAITGGDIRYLMPARLPTYLPLMSTDE